MTNLDYRGRYVSDSVSTASPSRLVTMLYDRLVLDLQRGEAAQRAGSRAAANSALLHAQDIVLELRGSLDDSGAWQGAAPLASLYAFLMTELVAANTSGDADRTAACRALVEPLREAWHEAERSLAGAHPA